MFEDLAQLLFCSHVTDELVAQRAWVVSARSHSPVTEEGESSFFHLRSSCIPSTPSP